MSVCPTVALPDFRLLTALLVHFDFLGLRDLDLADLESGIQ